MSKIEIILTWLCYCVSGYFWTIFITGIDDEDSWTLKNILTLLEVKDEILDQTSNNKK